MTKKQLISQVKECILDLDETTYSTLQQEHNTLAKILFSKKYDKQDLQNLISLVLQKNPHESYFIFLLEELAKRK